MEILVFLFPLLVGVAVGVQISKGEYESRLAEVDADYQRLIETMVDNSCKYGKAIAEMDRRTDTIPVVEDDG